jgi:probable HAF family extracellular repeat protein
MKNLEIFTILWGSVWLVTVADAQSPFSVEVLANIPGATGHAVYGIANDSAVTVGEVTGTSLCPNGCAVNWQLGRPTLLGALGGPFSSMAYYVNEAGQTVGTLTVPNADGVPGLPQAVIWNNDGLATLLPSPGPQYVQTVAHGINDAAQVVGSASESGGAGQIAVVWNGLTPTVLGSLSGGTAGSEALAINANGLIVGISYSGASGSPEAIVWSGTTATLLPRLLPSQGGDVIPASKALAINDEGVIVGAAATSSASTVAVAWANGTATNLGALGTGKLGAAAAVNNIGVIVGFSATVGAGIDHAALWSRIGAEPQDLNGMISAADAAEFLVTGATGINEGCAVVANGYNRKTGAPAAFLLTLNDGLDCNSKL